MKRFIVEKDGMIGITAGSSAYRIEVSKGDEFVLEREDRHWWIVKRKNPPKPAHYNVNNPLEGLDNFTAKVDWSKLLLCIPKKPMPEVYTTFREV